MPVTPELLQQARAALSVPLPGVRLDQVETPVPVIDIGIAERNIVRWQKQCDSLGLVNRPHIKTHKLAFLAHRQIGAGAGGVTCQKLGEAEIMADAGIADILLTYNVVGPIKLARLVALRRRTTVRVVADSSAVIAGLAAAMTDAGLHLDVLVECDTGGGRCGVAQPEAAAALASEIARCSNLRFAGWMTYPLPGGRLQSDSFFRAASALCAAAGLGVETVSTGGTPDMWSVNGLDVVTEYRAGTYIYNDRSRVERGICKLEDCALTVLATIVSRPAPDRAIFDAGTKVLSSDLSGLNGYGSVPAFAGATIPRLDEEHGYLQFAGPRDDLPVGSTIRVLPNHVCVVSNLVNEVLLADGGQVLGLARVDARGCVK